MVRANVLKRALRRVIAVPSVSIRSSLTRSTQDVLSYLSQDPAELVPPNRLLFDGSENREQYRETGSEFLAYLIDLAGLRPTDSILDVGCGIGRIASRLATYIRPGGTYDGFDIVPLGIRWCNGHIHARHAHFRFTHANVFNSVYNPGGTTKACDYRFPYPDGMFDVAIATSVFTHMLPCDIERYLAEISRVLKTGGRCLVTCLLRTEDAQAGIRAGKSFLRFEHEMTGCWVESADAPEAAVAYHERDMIAVLARHNLEPMLPIYYGSWCGREHFLSIQDIVVARKCSRASNASAAKENKS